MSALPRPRPERRLRPLALAASDNLATSAPIPFPSRRAEVGLVEWFRPGEYERAEQALADLEALGVQHLRTCLSLAGDDTAALMEWYRWLLPRLARQLDVLPCVDTMARDCAGFMDEILIRFGRYFEYLELRTGPVGGTQWQACCETIGRIAREAHRGGRWKTVLGGITPADSERLRVLCDRGLMEHIDVVGFHGFPGRHGQAWEGWEEEPARIQRLLDERRCRAAVWVTETGTSTWRDGEVRQCKALAEALAAPVPRVYWYSLHDLAPSLPATGDRHPHERDYHFGLKRCDGTPKLLFHLWSSGGLKRVREAARQPALPTQTRRLISFRRVESRGPGRIPRPPAPTGAPTGP